MRLVLVACCSLLLAACSHSSTDVDADHPLIGTWEFKSPGSDCVETSEYRTDGTSSFESATQKASSRYQITAKASAAGYYKLVDTLTESNGKPSCSGRAIPVGQEVTVYLKFRSATEMTMCLTESEERCIGSFFRRGKAAL